MIKRALTFTQIILPVFMMGLCISAKAQKLPATQPAAVAAPAKIKIDGKLDEWANNWQAFNKNTKLFYTLSNDDKNLYMIVKCEDVQNTSKIMAGGITLTINTADKKKEDNAYSVTFPIVSRANMRGLRRPRGSNQNTVMDSASLAELAEARKQALASIKEISVLGFKDITDTLISIYNEYSIKAAVGYDEKGNFQYELSLPLKLMNLTPGSAKEFAYNLKVNGMQGNARNPLGGGRNGGLGGEGGGRAGGGGGEGGAGGGGAGGGGRGGGGGGGGGGRGGGGGGFGGGGGGGGAFGGGGFGNVNLTNNDMMTPTDFWAKYTLIKK